MAASKLMAMTNSAFDSTFRAVGFTKGYNFVLWFVFTGALMGFTLARLPFLDVPNIFCAPLNRIIPNLATAPGECYSYQRGYGYVAIRLHLFCILPAAFLACFQFVPVVRHKVIRLHRINGYVILLLSLVSTAGVFMMIRDAQGGEPETHIYLVLLGVLFVVALGMGYKNVKQRRIAQHRVWMLRAWFYVCANDICLSGCY